MIIDCQKITRELAEKLKPQVAALPLDLFLAAILPGENLASQKFVSAKEKAAKELGINFKRYEVKTEKECRDAIAWLTADENCGGLIVQLPLPENWPGDRACLDLIPASKDPDCLGLGPHQILAPAVETVAELLRLDGRPLDPLTVAVVGEGQLIGRPVAEWLRPQVAQLLTFNSQSHDWRAKLKQADIIVSGAGQVGLFGVDDLKSDALVIDFGYGRDSAGHIAGDFTPAPVDAKINYTQTPGGTGPILVLKLLENFCKLNARKQREA